LETIARPILIFLLAPEIEIAAAEAPDPVASEDLRTVAL
jgi:hypothetical protein